MVNLANCSIEDLRSYFKTLGEPSYRAEQLIKWVYQLGVRDFKEMSNFSLKLRQHLNKEASLIFPEVIDILKSKDGTQKWIFKLEDGHLIETVYIPENDRGTLCCSTQVGCCVGCVFCATGKMGWKRNLTVGEILGQLAQVVYALSPDHTSKNHVITNLVFMGMGEPLLNYLPLIRASEIMLHDCAYGLSKYRVTVSTSGFLPGLEKLQQDTELSVALSLHAVTDDLRSKLVPMNYRYSINSLLSFLDNYFVNDRRRSVTIEYIMLAGINDSLVDAKHLAKLLANGRYKINLIPANFVQNSDLKPSLPEQIDKFRNYLLSKKISTITRKSRGQDIAAACGQLVTKYE